MQGTTVHLMAPCSFRRLALVLALVLALAEAALFVCAWRLGVLVEPGGGSRRALTFVLFGSALTLQATVVVGLAWTLVALSRTELVASDGVTIEHPWRRWTGTWSEIRRAWWQRGWLVIEVRGRWRRWYVRVADPLDASMAAFRLRLEPDAWLEGAALRAYLLWTVLPVVLGAIGTGGLALLAALHWLPTLAPP
jgi:hypothetical protein